MLDLAPVTDTVPSPAAAATNPPIGVLRREYGYDTATVASHATAFAQGLSDAGVSATTKHFPGLGRVTANPDTSSGVTDRTTVRGDAYVQPFRAVVDGGAGFLMMSTAYYAKIDPTHPAAFSSAIVTGMVRGDLGFTGVVVSDDLGNARQVAPFSPGTRAVSFLRAGGDLVLTVNPAVLPAMDDAVLAEARAIPPFVRRSMPRCRGAAGQGRPRPAASPHAGAAPLADPARAQPHPVRVRPRPRPEPPAGGPRTVHPMAARPEEHPDPEPLETDDVRLVGLGIALWALALVVLAVLQVASVGDVQPWWLAMCVCGLALGLVGVRYCQRRRDALPR